MAGHLTKMYKWTWLTMMLTAGCVGAVMQPLADEKPLNFLDNKQYYDCNDLRKSNYVDSGVYKLYLRSSNKPFYIHCGFTQQAAFNVIQRRVNGNVNFTQTLSSYVSGFGDLKGDYWAGLNILHHLTALQGNRGLIISMENATGSQQNVVYTNFMVDSHASSYRLSVSGYRSVGELQDELSYNNGHGFYTYDYPDPNNCAVNIRAGWWYNSCTKALLNGVYYPPGTYTPSGTYFDGMFWKSFHGFNYSLKFVSMVVHSR